MIATRDRMRSGRPDPTTLPSERESHQGGTVEGELDLLQLGTRVSGPLAQLLEGAQQ
jgi:hypothetical protein